MQTSRSQYIDKNYCISAFYKLEKLIENHSCYKVGIAGDHGEDRTQKLRRGKHILPMSTLRHL
jgi:hypothetical protein